MTALCILAAFLCFLYCFIVFRIRSGSRFYLIWGLGGLFFIALALMIKFDLWGGFPLLLRRVICGALLAGILAFVVAEGCIFAHYRDAGRPDLDYIIVLGAQMKPAGPSVVLKFRLDAAYEYLIENENTVCVVSGGQGANEPCTEAQGMYDYLVERGIAPERIIKEDKSHNTSQNINYSSAFLDREKDSVGIVTNNFHIFRATHIARKSGYQQVCGIAAPSELLLQANNMLREFMGVMKDFLVGNI